MTFIAMIDIGVQTHRNKSSYPTNTKDKFLSQPVFVISAVKIMSNGSVFRQIIVKICIKKN